MPRVVSFIVLLAVIILIGAMFFQVMVQFIVPLFLAAVLVVIFKPLHLWVLDKCGRRIKLSAVVTTLLIVLIVLLPTSAMVIRAVSEGAQLYAEFSTALKKRTPLVLPNSEVDRVDAEQEEGVPNLLDEVVPTKGAPLQEQPAAAEAGPSETASKDASIAGNASDPGPSVEAVDRVIDFRSMHVVIDKLIPKLNELMVKIGVGELTAPQVANVHEYIDVSLEKVAAPLALGGVRVLGSTLIGLAIMVLTLFYFFADGPNMVSGLMKLSPLDDTYEQELLDKFADISRSVVVAVLLSAIVQGVLAGIGYFFAGIHNVFFLTVLTSFLAMVPFVGAAAVWVFVCVYLFYLGATMAAIVLAIYCLTVVSMIDNFIKPIVLHGQANLHPLLALLSVIGGIQALGPIGILVGPMLVAFLQALLNMLNKELHILGQESDATGKPVVFSTAAGALASSGDAKAGLQQAQSQQPHPPQLQPQQPKPAPAQPPKSRTARKSKRKKKR